MNKVENYRGITLLSTLGKLFTRVINNRLTEWAEEYHIYVESQAGFRSGMGTTDNIFVLHNLITHILNKKGILYTAFVDFTKAFDFVVRDNLWYKLIKTGIRGKILNIIKSIYDNLKTRVKCFNDLSEAYECMLGVRQGESLSPFLFSMFLNDLEDTYLSKGIQGIDVGLTRIMMLLYADDILLLANSAEELQKCLDILKYYCDTWKLKPKL